MSPLTKWIALVEVRQKPGIDILGSGKRGAYLTAVGMAASEKRFKSLVTHYLGSMSLDVVDWDDIDLLADRLGEYEIEESIHEQAMTLTETSPVVIGCFHAFPLE